GDDDDSGGDGSADDDDDSAGAGWTFADVFAVVQDRCSVCHGGAAHSTGLAYDGDPSLLYALLVGIPSFQSPAVDRIEPGQPELSYVIHKLEGTHGGVGGSGYRMPYGCSGALCLDAATIDGIRSWIADGAPNN
ncbi:MAG TPA: hypothetical protein DIU15_12230, partial [Deltaproteobacteria bacterium]|nr:hypothetical protein [Deltaproteobacteria bacterium]